METGNRLKRFQSSYASVLLQRYSVLLVLLVLIIAASFMSEAFLSYQNIMNVLRQISTNAILSLGLLVVIMTGAWTYPSAPSWESVR